VLPLPQFALLHSLPNAIQRWLKQFQETGSVLHSNGAGRKSISQEDVRMSETFSQSPKRQLDELVCS
jgi:hypothetical protein